MRHIGFFTVIRLAAAVSLVVGSLANPARAGWEGTEVDKNGIPHMMSPARPMEAPVTRAPEKLWDIGGDEEEDYFFGVLAQITSDEAGNVYVLDMQLNEVMVFSPDGEYIRSIGREGEGPGEFRRPADLFITADGNIAVMQRMPGKIVVLTPEGDPVGDHPVPPSDGMRMFSGGRLAGDRLVLETMTFARHESGFDVRTILMSIDGDGKLQVSFVERENSRDFANMSFDEKTTGRNALMWSTDSEGRVFTSRNFDAYSIKVWRPDGTVERVIEREYEHRVRSEEERERNAPRVMIRRNDQTMRPETKTSETDRDIQNMFPRDDRTLWVLSSRGAYDAPEGTIATFDVFDHKGRFARQVTLEGEGDFQEDGFYIVKDRLYVVAGLRSARESMFGGRESDEPEPEDAGPVTVKCYDLTPVLQTRK